MIYVIYVILINTIIKSFSVASEQFYTTFGFTLSKAAEN
jgi:hypothetical protein